jgi:hypothetical protein
VAWCFFKGPRRTGVEEEVSKARRGETAPNTSLEPTADAALIGMSTGSSIECGVSLPRLLRLWLGSIMRRRSACPMNVLKRSTQICAVAGGQTVED